MSEDTVVKMRMLNAADTPTVSTILEEMFQFFDRSIRRRASYYRTRAMHIRLRLALMVFGDADYARLDVAMKP